MNKGILFLICVCATPALAADWTILPHASWTGNPQVSVIYHIEEGGVDIVAPTTLAGPFTATGKLVSANAYADSGRTLCLNGRARAVAPLVQPDSVEVESLRDLSAHKSPRLP